MWVRNVVQKAFYVLSYRILEITVAERNKSFQEPPFDYHKDIMTDLRRVLTASGNPHKNTQPKQLFQADLRRWPRGYILTTQYRR